MEESKKANNRIEYIDIARGIAIILMVIGHVVDQGWKREVIFSFHMPLFIIASGLFYKDKSLKENIKNIFACLFIKSSGRFICKKHTRITGKRTSY